MQKLRKYIVKNEFQAYLPQRSDFEIVREVILPIRNGEFLVKTEYVSVDPYMRSFATDLSVPYDQFGFQVGKVIDSKNPDYPKDSYVVSHSGWRDYVVLDGQPDEIFNIVPYKPQIESLPISLAIGALGMPGITAYLGLLEICAPRTGEVVCITSAAGAVGSLVGQIAKLKGCVVIGFTGSDEKVDVLKRDLGFHYAFNYKTETDVKETLRSVVKGIDCYFDNVGGDLASAIMECMNEQGRVAVCGAISTYGERTSRHKKLKMPVSVKIEAFSFTQWEWPKQCEALNNLKEWVKKGTIKAKETIANGFEELPDTFVAMLKGESIGKALVKI
ncbi:hypothetical protein K1T71_010992 [Dendrolimus kikuchii]|uniref:Uncharacterized protein n=1 Tax=Dendrolimus kikuchii TaxID=765133 RepID=A0ACC1CQG9_9NEOP|nr:hypothetical protein K1T71_010992 [Dendrolimus kikuchii]